MNTEEYISSGIIESYVLGLASAEERKEVEDMAVRHPEIREAISSCRNVMEAYGDLHAVQPPPALKSRVMDAIRREPENVRKETPGPTSISKENIIPLSNRKWKWIAAAAVVLLIVSTALNGVYIGKYHQYRDRYEVLSLNQQQLITRNGVMETKLARAEQGMKMLMNPDMKPVIMKGVDQHPGMVATIYWNPESRHSYLATSNLPAPPTGMAYQLWAIVDGKPTDMGMYNPAKEEGPQAMKNVSPGKVQAFAITLEKQEGSSVPTMDQMYVMGKI